MAYGMNFNGMNALAFAFPRTIGPNNWQYDMFGANGGVSPSIMSPNDSAGAYNDMQLFNFSCDANSMLNNSTMMAQQSIPLLQNLNSQLAAAWQKMIESISAGNNVSNITSNINNNNNANNNKKIGEDQIISTLEKMGSGDAVSDRINQEITIKDKDGKDVKTTILRRLISLCDEYRKDPKNAELSKENYEKIWEIANTYAKTGTISSDEFATLKEIALNPGGKKEEEDDADAAGTPMTDAANFKKTDEGYKSKVSEAASEYKDALFKWYGTNYDHLETAEKGTNADNIIEVYDEFYSAHGINKGETLIDSIYNDFDDWTDGLVTYGAASTFTKIHDKMAERAGDVISKYGDKDGKLQKALDNFNTRFKSINDDNYDSKKSELKSMFADIVDAIKAAEGGKLKEEKDATDKNKKK